MQQSPSHPPPMSDCRAAPLSKSLLLTCLYPGTQFEMSNFKVTPEVEAAFPAIRDMTAKAFNVQGILTVSNTLMPYEL